MRKKETIYHNHHRIYSIFMLLALVWLTVCTPFVFEHPKQIKKIALSKKMDKEHSNNESDPIPGSTEEKTENSGNTLSEYLHHDAVMEHHVSLVTSNFKVHLDEPYLAYHPEMVSPPPKV